MSNFSSEVVERVASHYNDREDSTLKERENSPILRLRNFNNWIKSVQIDRYYRRGIDRSKIAPEERGRVCDMACGKGGDFLKWNRAKVSKLLAIDLAESSIEQAKLRLDDIGSPHMKSHLLAYDAFHLPLAINEIPPSFLPVECVSCQFALHYAWETEESANQALENISSILRKDGLFFGTIPNSKEILSRLKTSSSSSSSSSASSRIISKHPFYKISFEEDPPNEEKFGQKYNFSLWGSLEDCPEFLIPLSLLEKVALSKGMRLEAALPFKEFFERYSQRPEYEFLLRKMRVVGPLQGEVVDGKSDANEFLSKVEEEIAELYLAFCFRKTN